MVDRPIITPRVYICGLKMETAVLIAIIFGILLWTAFCTILFFTIKAFAIFLFLGLPFSFYGYYNMFMEANKGIYFFKNPEGTVHLQKQKGRRYAIQYWLCVTVGWHIYYVVAPLICFFPLQSGYFILELWRTPCNSSGQCPEWSSRCPKNFAEIFLFDQYKPNCYKGHCPNEGVVERVFEESENLRFLKRKILEMAANHTNQLTNETLLESQLKAYFDDENSFESIKNTEANCELQQGIWKRRVLCAEKVAKLKQAFIDVYWAQVKKKQQRKMNSTIGHQDGQIIEDEIDSIFLVQYECHPLQIALAISIAFLIAQIAIFVFFIYWALPYFKWLDWAGTCPEHCNVYHLNLNKPCRHCPIRKMRIERKIKRNELTPKEKISRSVMALQILTQKDVV